MDPLFFHAVRWYRSESKRKDEIMLDIAFEVKSQEAGNNLRDLLCEGLSGLPAFKDNTIIVTDPKKTDAGRWAVFLNIGWSVPDETDALVVTNCTAKVTSFDATDYQVARDNVFKEIEETVL